MRKLSTGRFILSPLDLIASARKLMAAAPTDADMRRAMSAAYYALFHAIAEACADAAIMSAGGGVLKSDAWRLVYRALDHGIVRAACANKKVTLQLSAPLANLAVLIPRMQSKRHLADYDPYHAFVEQEVIEELDNCEAAIIAFQAAAEADRKIFLAFVLFRNR